MYIGAGRWRGKVGWDTSLSMNFLKWNFKSLNDPSGTNKPV